MPGPSTTAVHTGEGDPATGNVNTPIHQASTFRYPELSDGGPSQLIYSRYDNPTLAAVETKLAALEQAHGALLFTSGMAAVQAVCASFLRPGDTVAVQRGVYGGTTAYLGEELEPAGVRVHPFDTAGRQPLPEGTRLVWTESVSNPLLRVTDVRRWAEAAHQAGALLAVDATFATPVLQRPLELGADLVVHSASKYLGGHSDLLAGVVAYREGLHADLWQRRRNLGGVLDPHTAWLLGRSIKTLGVRMDRHQANAWALAGPARGHPAVRAVHYPGLPEHPDHTVARGMLRGPGGMLTLDLGDLEAARRFRRAVRVFVPAASLGGVESLVSLPLETSHAYAPEAVRRAEGIGDGLVRLSVGIEDIEDLREDLLRGLDAAGR